MGSSEASASKAVHTLNINPKHNITIIKNILKVLPVINIFLVIKNLMNTINNSLYKGYNYVS